MRATTLTLGVLLLVLTAGAVGAYAVDRSRADVIAEGVRIGSLEVGGMDVAQAREAVRTELVERLHKPVEVNARGEVFVLEAEEADVRLDVAGTVARALDAGRSQSLPRRLWRAVRGGSIDASLEPRIRYDAEAVEDLVAEIREASDQEPVAASAEISTTKVELEEGEPGVITNVESLEEDVRAAILDPGARRVEATLRTIEPEGGRDHAREHYSSVITVDRDNFKLRLFEDFELVETYPIALGRAGQDTPGGEYELQTMQVNPTWYVPNSDWAGALAGQVIPPGPSNPLKARWLGIYSGVGIHGTADQASIGTNASAGCIRMLVEDVKELYEDVSVGATVYIE
jgi:lipoprotein-anchoring transpeptidase ErfK/SrfK